MRQVATIPDDSTAKRLADYLLTIGISTRVDKTDKGSIIWVHREDRIEQARSEVAAFLAEPDNPKFLGASKAAEIARKEAARREREHLRKSVNLSGRLNVPTFERCPISYSLIAICVAVAFLSGFGKKGSSNQIFQFSPVVLTVEKENIHDVLGDRVSSLPADMTVPVPRWRSTGLKSIARGQVWRLVTPIFMHYSFIHLIFNMIMLYQLGCLIELRKGKLVMALLVLFTAVVSNCGEYFWDLQTHGPEHPIQFGGMSGVVYALFGYCWMKSDYEPGIDIKIPTFMIFQMVLWLLLCMSDVLGPIANAAHVAGLFSGLLIGVAPHLWHSWR